jgi:hypothetical protein
MIKLRERVLKNISIINILLLYYPTVLFAKVVVFKTNKFLSGFLVLLLALYFGVLTKNNKVKKVLNIEGRHKRILVNVLGSLLVFLFTYLFFRNLGRLRSVFEIIPALIFFQIGIIVHNKDYKDMFDTKDTVIGILGIIFLNIALFINGLKVPFLLYADVFLSIFSVLIIFNQVNIDNEIMSKSNTKGIPEYINKFNYNLMFKVFIYFIILFNLNFIVKYIIKLILKLGILIVNLIIKFFGLFITEKSEGTNIISPGNYNIGEGGNSVIGKILYVIFIIVIAILVIKYLPKLIIYIKNNFTRFLEYIKLLQRIRKKNH